MGRLSGTSRLHAIKARLFNSGQEEGDEMNSKRNSPGGAARRMEFCSWQHVKFLFGSAAWREVW